MAIKLYGAKPNDLAALFAWPLIIRWRCSAVPDCTRGSAGSAQYCELDVVLYGDLNRYTLTGCLPQRADPLPLAFAIRDGQLRGRDPPGTERGRDNTAARCCARRRC
ncbi:hypothetical protein KCP78_16110 [Salmonella enterica subsp. enterica]|nr:hypothetical protein KCP78_16110 [Salmonella enterica subsp. enterica]